MTNNLRPQRELQKVNKGKPNKKKPKQAADQM